MQHIDFELRGDFIPLDALLKATGLAESGGRAKAMVAEGLVQVDGRPELRKTAKLRAGQQVRPTGAVPCRSIVLSPTTVAMEYAKLPVSDLSRWSYTVQVRPSMVTVPVSAALSSVVACQVGFAPMPWLKAMNCTLGVMKPTYQVGTSLRAPKLAAFALHVSGSTGTMSSADASGCDWAAIVA